MSLTKSEIKKGVKYHYSSGGDYASAHLYLFKNDSFRFESHTCMTSDFSLGSWTIKNNLIRLTSNIQKDNVPIKLLYRSKDSSEKKIKRLAIPKDLTGRELWATIYVNNDTTACFDGDLSCFGNYSSIDSIRLYLNNGLSSPWVKVNTSGNEIVQIVLQSTIDLIDYICYNATFRRNKNQLIRVTE